jgi:hypothetical protein
MAPQWQSRAGGGVPNLAMGDENFVLLCTFVIVFDW